MTLLHLLLRKKNSRKIALTGAMLTLLSWHGVALASPWSGEGDIGFNKSSGNTRTESLLTRLVFSYDSENWVHTIELGATGSSDSGRQTAESYTAKWKSRFNIAEMYYSFGSTRYEKDRFSGYTYQLTAAAGVGAHLFKTERLLLDIEGGLGYRFSEIQNTSRDLNEATLLAGTALQYQLTETTQFKIDVNVEAGDDNIYLGSISALKIKINSALALKLAYLVKHNTDAPAGAQKTDTFSSVSLNYSF